MKTIKTVLSCLVFFSLFNVLHGQSLNDGMYSDQWVSERDAIIYADLQNYRNWQNDAYYDYIRNGTDPNIQSAVQNVVDRSRSAYNNNAQSGIQITNESASRQTVKKGPSQAQIAQQRKKAQDEADHQAWLDQRRAAMRAAAESRRQAELERQHRIYEQAKVDGYRETANHYNNMHQEVDYMATEGVWQVITYQPSGTERIISQYIPSPQDSRLVDVGELVNGKQVISLGDKFLYESSSNYDEYLLQQMKQMKPIELPQRTIIGEEAQYWDELRTKLNDVQLQNILDHLKKNNKGKLPHALGINDEGKYIFESEDGNHVFALSADGSSLQIGTFEENFWSDANFMKLIREDGLKKYLKDGISFKASGGSLDLTNLKKLSTKDLKNLLPEIKASMKLNLVDNSSTITYSQIWLLGSNYDVALKGELSSGGTVEANASAKLSLQRTGINADVSAVSTSASLAGAPSYVTKMGGQYYRATVSLVAAGSIGLSSNWKSPSLTNNKKESKKDENAEEKRTEVTIRGTVKHIFHGSVTLYGLKFENITTPINTLPTAKNKSRQQ
ncbi:MAG: hypothetical protein MJZ24_11315 [Paludibacteraceae bacterium]|nr:hypothetical protein [Paludibacteraceae bacterium]